VIHGPLLVNSKQIGRWTAVRQTTVAETGEEAPYQCTVVLEADRDVHGKEWPQRKWEGTIVHEVGLGALALVRAILEAAEARFREDDLY
jgi:hypothetical protein